MEDPKTEIGIRCICPDPETHPDGDVVRFVWPLDFGRMALINRTVRLEKSANPRLGMAAALAMLAELYLRHCLASWTLEEDGKPVPCNEPAIEKYLMAAHPDVALEVADAADDVYSEIVLSPLVQTGPTSSPAGRTEGSTSPTKLNGHSRSRKRSSQSSSSITPTAGIVGTA